MRNRKKRQKLRSGVKKRSRKSGIAAKSLHESKETVGYTRKNGKKFTRARTESADRKRGAGKTAKSLQRRKGDECVGHARAERKIVIKKNLV